MRPKIIIAFSVLLLIGVSVIGASFVVMLRNEKFTPARPPGWSQVHTGMTRSAVLKLAGPPRLSGWPEKVCETWQIDGEVCHRRLFVCYQGEGENTVLVVEGSWLRGYGWMNPRKESQ